MNKRTILLISFTLLKVLLQYWLISPDYDLQRDEYLHIDQGHHLAWGYLSVPPFTSWISYVIILLGKGWFWVKFFPALFGALTLVVVWKTIEKLGGNLFALVLGALCVLFSALLRLNTLFQPNSFDVLCWTTCYCTLIYYFNTGHRKWLFATAVVFAIGWLNKYNIAFLAAGLLPALLISRQRTVLAKPALYGALLLALALMLPNILWQYTHHFPVVHHMRELAATQLVHVSRADFFKSQLLFYPGALIVLAAALVALLRYPPFMPYRLFFWALLFTLAIFSYCKAKDYYAMGIYPIYIAFGAVYLGQVLSTGRIRYLKPLLLLIPVLLFIPLHFIAFPNKSPQYIVAHQQRYKGLGLLRWEDGKDHALPQDFADMLGWRQLANVTDSVYATLPHPDHTLTLCDNYGQAGAINYYKRTPTLIAHSFNADYIHWLNYTTDIQDAILVKEKDDDDPLRTRERPLFDTVYLAAQRINPFAREDTISIYVLRGAHIDVNQRIRKEAESREGFH